jgi:ATP-dependent helicase/nuclease subunit A
MRLADPGMPSHEVADALAEAARVLDDPVFAWLFAPGTLAEVEISAALPLGPGLRALGAIDRLVVARDRVVAVDFKTNAVVPERPEDVPEGILRQLGAYEAMLREVYPGRTIETAVLWTRRATLMTLPPEIVRYALGATPIP